MYPLLTQINKPEDIKKLSLTELEAFASELRSFIVATVAKNGGHLSPSFDTVPDGGIVLPACGKKVVLRDFLTALNQSMMLLA